MPTAKSKPKAKPEIKTRSKAKTKAGSEAASGGLDLLAPPPERHHRHRAGPALVAIVESRRNADPAVSHSARLLSRGTAKVAQKFGEEAVECLIEAVAGNHDALVAESADVLYHLLVLWVAGGVHPAEVWEELARREGVSGIAEKASRSLRPTLAMRAKTTKIP